MVARAEKRQVGELRGEADRVEEARGGGRDQEELEGEGGEAVEAVHPGNLDGYSILRTNPEKNVTEPFLSFLFPLQSLRSRASYSKLAINFTHFKMTSFKSFTTMIFISQVSGEYSLFRLKILRNSTGFITRKTIERPIAEESHLRHLRPIRRRKVPTAMLKTRRDR